MLAQSFKNTDIKTIEELVKKIDEAGITPKPEIEILDYIWDWKMLALDNLSAQELKNHSMYHAFRLSREDNKTKLRGKRYLFDSEWVPTTGIRILKEGSSFGEVDAAELRIEKLQLDKVFSHLNRFIETLPLPEKLEVGSSWERLRSRIEKCDQLKHTFPKMSLKQLQTQRMCLNEPVLPDHLVHLANSDEVPELVGEIFPESLNEADFKKDLRSGLVVCIYSDEKRGRPWFGRILKVTENTRFEIQWYAKVKGSRNTFEASYNANGSPYTSVLASETVMLWNFSSDIDDSRFHVSDYFLSKIKELYITNDSEFHESNQPVSSQVFELTTVIFDIKPVEDLPNIDVIDAALTSVKEGSDFKESRIIYSSSDDIVVQAKFTIDNERVSVDELEERIKACTDCVGSVSVASLTKQKSHMIVRN